ncbi:MAG: type IX secretion system membrane protein PorP/SprF [Muribaculaceae bacterium]
MCTAQTDAQFSQYYEAPSFYNPAAIGLTDFVRIRAGARLQWVGVDNAPQTFAGVADMPVKIATQRIGVGLMVNQESQGLYSTLNIDAQLGYKFKKLGGEWTVGLGIGMYDQSFKGSEVYLPDDDDFHQGSDEGIPTSDIHGTGLDVAAGIYYKHRLFWAGLSCTHLNNPTVTMTAEGTGGSQGVERNFSFTAHRTLYFMGGCNIPVKNTLFEIIPSVMVKSDFTFTTGEITARTRYRKFLSFGVGYRWNDAIIATVAAEIKNFYIGYSFDYSTTALGKASSGSHELWLGYSLKLDMGEKNRNRHKSVRLM